MPKTTLYLLLLILCFGCSRTKNKLAKKGFPVSGVQTEEGKEKKKGLKQDSLVLETKPRNVLLTKNAEHRLTPIFLVNYRKNPKKPKNPIPFTGSIAYHPNYSNYGEEEGNNWNRNFMPGFEAAYGYNFVNVSHYNNATQKENTFFEKPVLIRTLYYPAFSKDTLNNAPITRDFYMVSTYDEDTNKDGYINVKDLRRFYHFDLNAQNKSFLIPKNYSVMSSEYDSQNDFMYIFARLDENENGQMEYEEATHIFWIDLKNPQNKGMQYQGE